MKAKKFLYILFLILLFLLLLVPNSCVVQKSYKSKYPKDSEWIYYDGVGDSVRVYISHYSMFGNIVVKDSLNDKAATSVGGVKEEYLFPIK